MGHELRELLGLAGFGVLPRGNFKALQDRSSDSRPTNEHCTPKIGTEKRDKEDACGATGEGEAGHCSRHEQPSCLQTKSPTLLGREYSQERSKCKKVIMRYDCIDNFPVDIYSAVYVVMSLLCALGAKCMSLLHYWCMY